MITPGLLEYFSKKTPSENQSYLDNGTDLALGQVYMLHDGTAFGDGCDTLKGVQWAIELTS